MIVLGGPGAAARELHLPSGLWVWLTLCAVLSIAGSLLLGRKARAWVDESAPARLPIRSESHGELDVARLDVVHVPLTRLPFEPEPLEQDLRGQLEPERPFSPDPALSGAELELFDVNAKQALRVRPFDTTGAPDRAAFASLREFLRCRRTGQARDMSPKLVALLTRIASRFGSPVLQVISAHRVPDGNVTRDSSQHVRGTAADIRIAGVSVETLAERAREVGAQGVGIYPTHRFVHVDVRSRAYSWREGEKARDRAVPSAAAEDEAPPMAEPEPAEPAL